MQSEIRIGYYEEWMKPQVAGLFEQEYKTNKGDFEVFFSKFYEHVFQKNKCIRIVALDQDKVVGFQSFFYWPYVFKGKVFSSYQSGNSLVHPEYRGKGLFKLMLNFIYTDDKKNEIDFLMGFPVEASYPSFIKNGWLNILNLRWSVKLINPFAFLFSINTVEKRFLQTYTPTISQPIDFIKLSEDSNYTGWRKNYSTDKIICFVVKENGHELCFHLKVNKRSRFIHELIIGNITSTAYDEGFLSFCFTKLIKEVRKSIAISILSIAVNEHLKDESLLHVLSGKKFKFINKQIHFIIKPIKENSVELINDPKNWMLLRGDIDTW
jgi:GNAT superfamily N-acetyltransferase